jgi:hypothetical protein
MLTTVIHSDLGGVFQDVDAAVVELIEHEASPAK